MKINPQTVAKIILTLSIISIIIGYFLWTMWIPIQVFHLMNDVENLRAPQELTLNYPLSSFLLYTGFIRFILSIAYLGKEKTKKILIKLK